MKVSVLVSLLVLVAVCSAAVTQFTADVSVTNDKQFTGIMNGKIFWTAGAMKIQFDVGVTQLWDYSDDVLYKRCTECESATMNDKPWRFVVDANYNTKTTNTKVINGVTCTQYNTNENPVTGVQTLWADANGVPCQAVLGGKASGRTYTFTNVNGASVPASTFDVSSWNCPTKKCKLPADVVVVVDKSGSISNEEWAQATSFVKQFAAGFGGFQSQAYYNSNPQLAVRMGLIWFSTVAVDKTKAFNNNNVGGVTADRNTFNNAANADRGGNGNTNIGDGIKHALAMLYQDNRDVDKILLFLTDGKNTNNAVPLGEQLTRLQNYVDAPSRRLTSFSVGVGVGGALDEPTLLRLAGNERDNYVPVGKYSNLAGKIQDILSKTCPANTDSSCTCNGFCACAGKCLCPSDCPHGKCQTSVCRSGPVGCEAPVPFVCVPSHKCVDSTCNPSLGTDGQCVETTKVCPSSTCDTPVCDRQFGCGVDTNLTKICSSYTQGCTTCDKSKPKGSNCVTDQVCKCTNTVCDATVKQCKYSECDNGSGNCAFKDVNCDDGNPCTDDSCDPNGLGVCEHKEKNCDDSDMCTTDTCDSTIAGGCVHTPRNATIECDDFSVCTNDTCDPTIGCVNTIIPCTAINATDPCLNTTCDPVLGCLALPTDCYAANANISLLIGDCQTVQCNDTAGCYLLPIDGAVIDECGVCKGSARPFFCNKAAVAGIAVGTIVGAAVGAAAGAVLLGVGGKKGYDFLQARGEAQGGIQNNPMYVDNANNNNPLFNG
eukprot:TRINITY_DN545_c0_g1_i5.p1 TRINITY_DN545_c0_g1~~TRINITY_DN545_c0_g1_i5.p1  ORF type:complete len:769 (-),score=217.00 TRINITY_DN545_c0_g1_i5:253-2559(-)